MHSNTPNKSQRSQQTSNTDSYLSKVRGNTSTPSQNQNPAQLSSSSQTTTNARDSGILHKIPEPAPLSSSPQTTTNARDSGNMSKHSGTSPLDSASQPTSKSQVIQDPSKEKLSIPPSSHVVIEPHRPKNNDKDQQGDSNVIYVPSPPLGSRPDDAISTADPRVAGSVRTSESFLQGMQRFSRGSASGRLL